MLTACQASNSQVGIGSSVLYGNSSSNLQNKVDLVTSLPIPTDDLYIKIKGLNNIVPEYYTAIFEITQTGKTVEDVDSKMKLRVDEVLNQVKSKTDVDYHLDMISLIPRFSINEEKKIFSKNSYKEVPEGFELKKNMHLKFKDGEFLNEFVSIMAQSEIYNLVRVEAYSDKIEEAKTKLMEETMKVLTTKLDYMSKLKAEDLASYKRQVSEQFNVLYPTENYKIYSAYTSSEMAHNSSRSYEVEQVQKSKTSYFQPLSAKQFDFVLNPGLLIPYIQVVYSVNVNLIKPKKQSPVKNKYMVIGQNGTVTELEKFE